MTQRSITDLAADAPTYLEQYCSPHSRYAWPAYDIDPNPDQLVPADVLAPALLSYPINGKYLQQMFERPEHGQQPNAYAELFDAMSEMVRDEASSNLVFDQLDLATLSDRSVPGWSPVLRALDVAQRCSGLTSVAVTKILHRKRPDLVPINDSRVRTFYGIHQPSYERLFESVHRDVTAHHALLDRWRAPYAIDGRVMTRLRCLDIVIWMHPM